MKPERSSRRLLSITRSKAKMYEYGVALEHHIEIPRDPAQLLPLSIGLLGDLAAQINSVDNESLDLSEQEDDLQFSAQFFDSYLQSRLNTQLNPYILLMGAASYYLCNLPGSSIVLTRSISQLPPDLDAMGLEDLLLWVLRVTDITNNEEPSLTRDSGSFGNLIQMIAQRFLTYYRSGQLEDELFNQLRQLRELAYQNGTARQLLFADIVCALIRKRHKNATWSCLPKYSHLSVDSWRPIFQKPTFIHELWPAQHLLGEHGVFAGESAVVQMPTSAGKTRAIEIIMRSAFLAQRASTVAVVAPFRALCHEISMSLNSAFAGEDIRIDEFSDVLQPDLQEDETGSGRHIWIVTPEKLLYMLRQVPTLAEQIGLLIYDEGHQFDNGIRGVTYELLLTSLKSLVPSNIQVVLISAVINNADQVRQWLIPDARVVTGLNLIPTFRTVAFATWSDYRGRLEFVTPTQPDQSEFFVPRILEEHELGRKPRERNRRVFPDKSDSRSIALYLGLKLAQNGSVAIFCGTKPSAVKCSEQIVDVYDRNLALPKPIEFSVQEEVQKLAHLHELNLGSNVFITQSARLGVFTHHNNVPHGIRLAVEYALKENLVKFVICTSTLAQGVNLPIRYLILSNTYQAGERIKVRDFHNLIGRAGRSGIHTEGSVIFADPTLFESRNANTWKWQQVTELLLPENSEPCLSTLLSVFNPLESDNGKLILDMDILELVQMYILGRDRIDSFIEVNTSEFFSAEWLGEQIAEKIGIIAAIESYLLAHWDDSKPEEQRDSVHDLATGTFAYFLADTSQKNSLVQCFRLLAENIERRIPQVSKRKVYGRTLYGVWTSIAIENWVRENINSLLVATSQEELLLIIWPLLDTYIANSTFKKCDPSSALNTVASLWIEGQSFHDIHTALEKQKAKLIAKTQRRTIYIEHIVDICENALAFEGGLIVCAVIEMIGLLENFETENLIRNLQQLQKRLKYGLPPTGAIALYEVGFADRIVAIELTKIISPVPTKKREILARLKTQETGLRNTLDQFPRFFSAQLDNLLTSPNIS